MPKRKAAAAETGGIGIIAKALAHIELHPPTTNIKLKLRKGRLR